MGLLVWGLMAPVEAKQHRSRSAVAQFKKATPCPLSGPGTCFRKGYVVDHIIALCAGGLDIPENMQYQTIAEAKAKDRWECRK